MSFLRSPEQFYRSYLLAYVFWIGFPVGSMAILMLHHLTGGDWGLPIRRPLEAASRTFPLMLILFLPVIFGLKTLFPWALPRRTGRRPDTAVQAHLSQPEFLHDARGDLLFDLVYVELFLE